MNEIGIISEVQGDKARVAIGEMVTDFLPVFQSFSNSFAVSFNPIRVGEQVLVLPVRGELNSGVILRGLYQNKHKLDAQNNKTTIVFEDGAIMSYNSSSSTLEVSSLKTINFSCKTMNLNGDLIVSGNITDTRGDLTGHKHSDTDGATSLPR